MLFSQNNMIGLYNWGKEESVEREPNRKSFDRCNGNQVLYIINYLLNIYPSSSIEEGKKIELMLIRELPQNKTSEISVCNWLINELFK